MNRSHTTKCFKISFGDIPAYTFSMKVKDLIYIRYVAVRGIDTEEGAVQRFLNKNRIKSIKNYVLDGNMFFNSFIINWTDKNCIPKITKEKITIPIVSASAQIIDGQHRVAGLEDAMKEKESIGEQSIIITLCQSLTTEQLSNRGQIFTLDNCH